MDPQIERSIRLSISSLDEDANIESTPNDAEMARRLQLVAKFVRAHSTERPRQDPTKAPPWFSFVPNRIGEPTLWSNKGNNDDGGMGAVDIAYGAGFFRLGQDEGLEITGRIPKCKFANVVLWNRFLQTLDYRSRNVSLNRKQMIPDSDGTYRILLSARPSSYVALNETCDSQLTDAPSNEEKMACYLERQSTPNWLDSEGRGGGIIFWRFVLPEEEIQKPETRLVRLVS
mmetsp:Transcript_17773/g.43472  ORF Transcript_17773/g.43472 Transcript_17773/m.43472 type:complete len:230 (+) Transcript_17773:829-1518(+)